MNAPSRVALGRRPVVAGGQGLRAMALSVALHAALLPAWWASTSATALAPVASSRAADDGAAVRWSLSVPVARADAAAPRRAAGTSSSGPSWEPPQGPAVPEPSTTLADPTPAPPAPADRGLQVEVEAHTIRSRVRVTPGRPVARVAPWPALARIGDRASDELGRLGETLAAAAEAWADRAALQRALAGRVAPTEASAAPSPVGAATAANAAGPSGAGFVAATPAGENAAPRYPGAARRRGWEGVVTLVVAVSPRGRVESVSVLRSSGRGLLDRAAVDAVTSWRFEPATRGGLSVGDRVELDVGFRLEEGR